MDYTVTAISEWYHIIIEHSNEEEYMCHYGKYFFFCKIRKQPKCIYGKNSVECHNKSGGTK